MKVYESLQNWIRYRNELVRIDQPEIGFVPTMGALHEGHLQLVRRARAENQKVIVSIFVNPTQFNNAADLLTYPRDIKHDLALLENENVDYVLLPNTKEIYPDSYRYKVIESEFSKKLCGAHRPGHFDGVLSVVLKLLNLAQAKRCYMGEKDYQQFLLVREMTQSFFLPTEVIPHPTVREESGLAMSSRNERLSPEGKIKAAQVYKLLTTAASAQTARQELQGLGFEVEYIEEHYGRRFAAVQIENVRLIDNVLLE